jgi:transposase
LGPILIGVDPFEALGESHLARLVDAVVRSVPVPAERSEIGQRGYSPAMLASLLIYAYATGTFSSRRIAQNCREHLAYMLLSGHQAPCHKTLCSARLAYRPYLEEIWMSLIATAAGAGVEFVGRISIDATRFKASTSRDLVVASKDYDETITRFHELLERAAGADASEDEEGVALHTSTGVQASRITVRQVVRSVGSETPAGELTPRSRKRLKECEQTLRQAKEKDLKFVSLSDPDARMMPIGSRRAVLMGHALEVAADSGLAVSSGTINATNDKGRLLPMVEQAEKNDPAPIVRVSADSGYFRPQDVLELQGRDEPIETIVPDASTAKRMRTGDWNFEPEPIKFEPVEGRLAYRCPQGNMLYRRGEPQENGRTRYRASHSCVGCPLASVCLSTPQTQHRTMYVNPNAERLAAYLQSFSTREVQSKYYARGPGVETVFAFIRAVLGFSRWSVRGSSKVAAEGALLTCAYQIRKFQSLRLKRA